MAEDREQATQNVLRLLDEWGTNSKFIWFRELHRITDLDKGLLRNIINDLKKSKEIVLIHSINNRLFFCLKKYYPKCRDVDSELKGKYVMLRDGSKVKIISGETKSSERTRKRLEKQQKKRLIKTRARIKYRKTRPHKS